MLGLLNVYLRRYPEARRAIDSGLALAPANLALIVAEGGDLAAGKATWRAPGTSSTTAPGEVEPTALVAFLAPAAT